jgi:hypothetical protein
LGITQESPNEILILADELEQTLADVFQNYRKAADQAQPRACEGKFTFYKSACCWETARRSLPSNHRRLLGAFEAIDQQTEWELVDRGHPATVLRNQSFIASALPLANLRPSVCPM